MPPPMVVNTFEWRRIRKQRTEARDRHLWEFVRTDGSQKSSRAGLADQQEGEKVAEDWWRRLEPDLWEPLTERVPVVRELLAAVLGALLLASTRTPMSTLADVRNLLAEAGYHDPISNEDLDAALKSLIDSGHVEPLEDYTAAVSSYADAKRRRDAWALTKQARIMVTAVRDVIDSLDRSLQLPPRLLDAVGRLCAGHSLTFTRMRICWPPIWRRSRRTWSNSRRRVATSTVP